LQNASFDPGGKLLAPLPSNDSRITIKVYSQYSYYTSTEKTATFVIDTMVSSGGSYPFKNWTYTDDSPSTRVPLTEVTFRMSNDLNGNVLVKNVRIPVNEMGNKIEVDLEGVRKSGSTSLSVMANSPDAIQTFHSASEILIMPERKDTGSMARIDRLTGGLQVQSSLTNHTWKNIFPYSFYTSWDWIASTINNATAPKNLTTFRELGYNLIHPVPPGGNDPFDPAVFEEFLTICDKLELYVMYDMRHTYQNNTSITKQLSRLQSHPSLLLYYTADEPDGWCDPLNATSIAYKHIHQIDPYHPISLVLNCANFHFEAYTAGADIILEDTYPVIISSTYSPVYDTPCNATYGDCGCDNCHVGDPAFPDYVTNPFRDISDRVDNLYGYQDWINIPTQSVRKPVWGVPQAFFDAGSFWSRWPTAEEEAVMALLRVVHGAMGIVAWLYPTSEELEKVTAQLATVLTRQDVTDLLISGKWERLQFSASSGEVEKVLEGAVWSEGDDMLVIILHLRSGSLVGEGVSAALPARVEEGWKVLYGFAGWKQHGDTNALYTEELGPLSVSILKARIKGIDVSK
jgi:hypothetical protein